MLETDHVIDLTDILDRSHDNKWVALSPDYRSVLAASDSLVELNRVVGDRSAVFHRVLPRDVGFAPTTLQ